MWKSPWDICRDQLGDQEKQGRNTALPSTLPSDKKLPVGRHRDLPWHPSIKGSSAISTTLSSKGPNAYLRMGLSGQTLHST